MKNNTIKAKSRRHFIAPSTRAFYQEAKKTPGFTHLDWLHGYVYSRWPYLYIGIGTGEHWLAKFLQPVWHFFAILFQQKLKYRTKSGRMTFADTYHGKVVPLEKAVHLVTINEEIELKNLEQVIPYATARDIIMKNPDHIAVLECPCRAVRSNPCQPLDVCLIIGEPFAGLVIEHHPNRSRWITQQEAVDILQAEHERGHVHHAFFKDAMLGRFYAICNCCDCCCGAMQAHQNGTPMIASSGYVVHIDEKKCKACGDCVKVCQFGAIRLNGSTTVINQDLCMGCGVCVSRCEQGAHVMVLEPRKGEPLEIRDLIDSQMKNR